MTTIIILFVAGLILILAEFIVPGAVLGILGGVLVIVSGGMGIYQYPEQALLIVMGEVFGLAVSIVAGMYIMTHWKAVQIMVLRDRQSSVEGYSSPTASGDLMGKVGEVYSALRPAGAIMVNGERVSAVSSGEFIPKGARVRVIEVEGHRVVVETLGASEPDKAS